MKLFYRLSFLTLSLFFSVVSSVYLRSENTVFNDDGINFQETKLNQTTEDYTLPREEVSSNQTTEDYVLAFPREEVEEDDSCKSISKHLYIHLLFEDDLKITDVEVSNFDVAILLD